MAELSSEKNGPVEVEKKNVDPELFSCLLQPVSSGADPDYVGIRRLLLHRKAESVVLRRRVSFSLQPVLSFVLVSYRV